MVYSYPARYNDDKKNYPEVSVSFPPNFFYERCGIIPYYRDTGGELYVILGVYRDRIKQLMSFGGKSHDGEKWENCSIREFGEESYDLITKLSDTDMFDSIHVHSQKCILSIVKIDTINEYYSFELIKKLAEFRYLENMKTKRSDQWETLTFEKFTLDEFESLIFGSKVKEYELWNFDRVMLSQKWNDIVQKMTNWR